MADFAINKVSASIFYWCPVVTLRMVSTFFLSVDSRWNIRAENLIIALKNLLNHI